MASMLRLAFLGCVAFCFAADLPDKCVEPPRECDFSAFTTCESKAEGDACSDSSTTYGSYESVCSKAKSKSMARCEAVKETGKTPAGQDPYTGKGLQCRVPQAVKVAAGYHDGKGTSGQDLDADYVPSTVSKCEMDRAQGGCPKKRCSRDLYMQAGPEKNGKKKDGTYCGSKDEECLMTLDQCEKACKDHTTFYSRESEKEIPQPCTHYALYQNCGITGTWDADCCESPARCYLWGECAEIEDHLGYDMYSLVGKASDTDASPSAAGKVAGFGGLAAITLLALAFGI